MTVTLTMDTTIVQCGDRTSATIDEVTAVMDPDADAYLLIDAVGSDIWTRIAEPRRIGDICDDLVTAYDVDAQTCSRDVLLFANDLFKRGLAKTG